jgi:hypothetical protein
MQVSKDHLVCYALQSANRDYTPVTIRFDRCAMLDSMLAGDAEINLFFQESGFLLPLLHESEARVPLGVLAVATPRPELARNLLYTHGAPSMPAIPTESPESCESIVMRIPDELERKQDVIVWSSFLLALLQSICGAIVAIDGLRLAIGMGALALSTGAGAAMIRFHADSIRIPMMAVALIGSLLNLAILIHVRHLRNRPAAQWRRKPLSLHQKRTEHLQMILSLATLVLIGVEEYLHFGYHHSL